MYRPSFLPRPGEPITETDAADLARWITDEFGIVAAGIRAQLRAHGYAVREPSLITAGLLFRNWRTEAASLHIVSMRIDGISGEPYAMVKIHLDRVTGADTIDDPFGFLTTPRDRLAHRQPFGFD